MKKMLKYALITLAIPVALVGVFALYVGSATIWIAIDHKINGLPSWDGHLTYIEFHRSVATCAKAPDCRFGVATTNLDKRNYKGELKWCLDNPACSVFKMDPAKIEQASKHRRSRIVRGRGGTVIEIFYNADLNTVRTVNAKSASHVPNRKTITYNRAVRAIYDRILPKNISSL